MNRDARGGPGPLAGAPGPGHARPAGSGPPRWRAPPPARRDGPRVGPAPGADAAKGAWSPDAPVVGTDYKIVRLLGSGGMGTVYEVEHLATRQHYAMKVLSARVAERPDFAARLLLEARTLAALPDQPHLVKVYESGTLPQGRPYYVMELLAGETLRAKLNRGRPPMPYACLLVVQLLAGLAAVHGAGIVHRDVKPDNLFIRADGVCKLLDFGVIKVLSESGLSPGNFVTVPGSIIGTRHYLAPEVIEARGPDKRADIFAAGVVLAECLTGSLPLADAPEEEYHRYVFQHGFPPLEGPHAAHVPAELREIVARATRRDPAQRYASVEAFATELASAAARLGLGSLTARSSPPEPATVRPPPLRAPTPPVTVAAPSATSSGNTEIDVPCTLAPVEHVPRYPSEGATLIREPAPDSLERSRPSGSHRTPDDEFDGPPDTSPRGAPALTQRPAPPSVAPPRGAPGFAPPGFAPPGFAPPGVAPPPGFAPPGFGPSPPAPSAVGAPPFAASAYAQPALGQPDSPAAWGNPAGAPRAPDARPALSPLASAAPATPPRARFGRAPVLAAVAVLATAGLGLAVVLARSSLSEPTDTLAEGAMPSGAPRAPKAHPLAWGDGRAPSAGPAAPAAPDEAPAPPAAPNEAAAEAPAAASVAAATPPPTPTPTPAPEAAAPAANAESAPAVAAAAARPANAAAESAPAKAAGAATEAAPARAVAAGEGAPAKAAGAATEAAPAKAASAPPAAAEAAQDPETAASAKRPANATQPHRLKRGFKSGL